VNFTRDIAIDLGTANVLVWVRGVGVVIDEPAVVTMDTKTGHMVAAGAEAKAMIGRTPPRLTTVRPLRAGVITDFDTTERFIRYLVGQATGRHRRIRPRLVVAVPSGLTGVERRAVNDACVAAGAREVHLLDEPLAAAIGADLPINEPRGSMIVDIGGGTTETAITSLGGLVSVTAARIGGDDLDEAITTHVKREYSVAIGPGAAEQLKIELGSAFPGGDEDHAEVRGRDLVRGLPRTVTLDRAEVRRGIADPVTRIVDTVNATLDRCPPELASDIVDSGITVTGGGALLTGIEERLRHETGLSVSTSDNPLRTVVTGAGRCVDHFDELRSVLALTAG
jgi:rod shape-determining protein MreB and related proteins